ncbi:MAG: ATP synthase F1 subunit gamma [Phycisphaerales bacterium]|nr:ATP synthase F1 subunit gamma [Phycisphaerales bacterium]
MAKTREIKKRIKAVGNIRRITKTMQMIATSKFARAQAAAVASKPYTRALFDLVAELAATITDVTHPLLASDRESRPGKPLTLVITSDRGLCGPYNGSVLRLAMNQMKTIPGLRDGLIELVGKKGAGFLKFAGVSVARHHAFGDKPNYETIQALAGEYIQRFMAGEVSSVRVVYMRYISAGKQTPEVLQLLPFQGQAATPAPDAAKATESTTNMIYEFSPDAQGLLDDLLPAAVKALLFQAFNDAVVSEHVARMVAMKSATDNAGKAGKKYTRIFNRARQSQITTELTEIISGAAALA